MEEEFDVIIIGGGQAGLSASYCLTQQRIKHLILEQGQIGETWRTRRWDSFTLVSPNCTILFPGFNYSLEHPNGFMKASEFIRYLEDYAKSFNPPIRLNTKVTSLQYDKSGHFILEINNGSLKAKKVIIATGGYHSPKKPDFANQVDASIQQITSEEYRNPTQIQPGGILVVGSGQSGSQIAEELFQAGRKVFLSVGGSGRWPRRYRGKDIHVWLSKMEQKTIEMMPEPKPRYDSNPHLTGRDGGRELNLRSLGSKGIILLGRLISFDGTKMFFADNLEESLLAADYRVVNVKNAIDKYISQTGIDVPKEERDGDVLPGKGLPDKVILELDVYSERIKTIIWAIGYKMNFNWIKLPIFDEHGFPAHTRGVSVQNGLYFLGLPWLYRGNSSGVTGVGQDAEFIANHIVDIFND